MTYLIALVAIFIFSKSTEPWEITWPMFESSTDPEFCYIGFGDWCVPSEGPHPGLDFKEPVYGDIVLSPANVTTWVYAVYYDSSSTGPGGGIILDTLPFVYSDDLFGWQVGHLDSLILCYYVGFVIEPKQPLTGVFYKTGEWFPHIHLNWYENGLWGNNINPFNYLDPPAGYDSLHFRRIPYIEDALNTAHGIVFDIQDEYANLDARGDMNHWHGNRTFVDFEMFQEEVFGLVDFIVSPASVDCIAPFADSMAGVKEILVDIRTRSGFSTVYSSRKFTDFINGVIPSIYEHMDEYNAMFFDPKTVGWPGELVSWYFNTTYIASNCGCMNGSFNTCYDNIWPDYLPVHDWDTGEFNRGCWDTRLRKVSTYQPGYPDQAFISENAAFPDGYYAVEITATTHGNDTGTILLPHENRQPDVVRGISVNNFYPHIHELEVFDEYCNDFYTAEYLFDDFMIPGESERTLEDWFGPRPESSFLAVNVIFSEPVLNDDCWITCVSGPDTLWSSELERTPLPYNSQNKHDGFHQVLYTFHFVPEGYLGKFILCICANDQSICEYELDSDPVTIPQPINGYYCSDSLYEAGITQFEWNVGKYVSGLVYGSWDSLYVKTENSGDFLYYTTISEAIGDPYAFQYLIPPNCTKGDGQGEHKGFCDLYAGYWLRHGRYFDDYYYNKCYICRPSAPGEWDSIEFALPCAYPPPNWNNDSTNDYLYRGYSIDGFDGDELISFPYSFLQTAQSTYSNGAYLFAFWNDFHIDSTSTGHITCISAISGSMKTIDFENANVGQYNSAYVPDGDSTWAHVEPDGSSEYYTVYYHPYSPEFFPEEDPDYCSASMMETDCTNDLVRSDNTEAGTVFVNSTGSIYPSPAMSSVTIPFSLAATGAARIDVYDVTGRIVTTLAAEEMTAGQHSLVWNLRDSNGSVIPSGVYHVRISTADWTGTTNLVVTK